MDLQDRIDLANELHADVESCFRYYTTKLYHDTLAHFTHQELERHTLKSSGRLSPSVRGAEGSAVAW